jgi:hypothetical protein
MLIYRRAEVTAFWIAASALAAAVAVLVAVTAGAGRPWAWAAAAAALLTVPGAIWAPWFERGIWFWNGAVRRLALGLRRYVLFISYFIVVAAVGRSGSALELRGDGVERSRWIPRPTEPRFDDRAWAGALQTFARTPGNAWAFCLLPVVFVLRLLAAEHDDAVPPGSTYTLY